MKSGLQMMGIIFFRHKNLNLDYSVNVKPEQLNKL
jgi:hypothetical protein